MDCSSMRALFTWWMHILSRSGIVREKIIYFLFQQNTKKSKMFRKFGYYFNDFNKCLKFMNSNIQQKISISKNLVNQNPLLQTVKINSFF